MSKLKILTVANRKGGAGKSTCAAHIAVEAVKAGYKTLLIDLDPQKTLELWWNKREEENPYLADDVSATQLSDKIATIKKNNFDLCIIDTPGDTSANAIAGIKAADLVLIPSKPTAPDLNAIARTITMVQEAEKPFVFLVTQAIARSSAALQAASVLSEFGSVAPCTIGHRVSYANAMSSGTTAASLDNSSEKELKALWEFIQPKLYGSLGNKNGKTKI